jgi:hypothetical protein
MQVAGTIKIILDAKRLEMIVIAGRIWVGERIGAKMAGGLAEAAAGSTTPPTGASAFAPRDMGIFSSAVWSSMLPVREGGQKFSLRRIALAAREFYLF